MALPITVPYVFGNVTSSIPLTNLDSDFATIYAAVNGIGNGTVALANVTITGGSIQNVSVTLDTINNTPIGNTTPSTGAFTSLTDTGLTSGRVTYAGTSGLLQDSANLLFNGTQLGIGVSPVKTLDILNSSATSTTPFANQIFQIRSNGSGADATIQFTDSVTYNTYFGSGGGNMYWNTGGTERMRIDSSGNVGIGTSSPVSRLSVAADETGYTNDKAQITIVGATNANQRVFLGYNTSTDKGFVQATKVGTAYQDFLINPSGGNVGIGTTSPTAKVDINGTSRYTINVGNSYVLNTAVNPAVSAFVDLYTNANQHLWQTGGSERMRIASGGFVGIGTSSPQNYLDIGVGSQSYNPTYTGTIRLNPTSVPTLTNSGGIEFIASGYQSGYGYRITSCDEGGGSTPLTFQYRLNSASWTEGMRLTNTGNLLLNATSALGKFTINQDLGGVGDAMDIKDTGSSYGSGAVYIKFLNNAGSLAGSIQHTASTTTNYNTSSDERLKTDKGIAIDTSVIDNTIIHDYEWKEDGRLDRGVFAQEAYQVKPSAVAVGDDKTNEEGILLNPWGVDYSKYVPDLIVYCQQLNKAIQEQQAIIEQLKAKVGL